MLRRKMDLTARACHKILKVARTTGYGAERTDCFEEHLWRGDLLPHF